MSLLLINKTLPLSYELQLTVDHQKPNYTGVVKIPLSPEPRNNFSLTLNAHRLIITNASANCSDDSTLPLTVTMDRPNQKVTFHTESDGLDATASDPAISASASTSSISASINSVTLTFIGSVSTIKTFKDQTYGLFKTNYSDSVHGKSNNFVLATHMQPFSCRTVFPVLDDIAFKAPITLSLITHSLFKVTSNTEIVSVEPIDLSENSIFKFAPTPPILSSLFGFVAGHLEVVELVSSDIPISIYCTRGDTMKARYSLEVLTSLLPHFVTLLGDYPLKKFDLVALPFLSDSVMENWGMVTAIRDSVLLDVFSALEDSKFQLRQLLAHQLAHQWFANIVSLDEWKYLWFVESFATFTGNYVLSKARIVASDSETYLWEKLNLIQDMMDSDCFADDQIPCLNDHMNSLQISTKSVTSTIFDQIDYQKGMILLNMVATLFQLENNESDFSSFFSAFSMVLDRYKFQTIKLFDIWTVLNESVSFDVLSFVGTWVRSLGFPLVKVLSKDGKLRVEQNRFFYNDDVVSLKLENQPFHIPLALKVVTDDGLLKTLNLILSDRSLELDIRKDQFVCLNSNNQFYYKTVYSSEIQELQLAKIQQNVLSSLDVIGIIKDYGKILGQEVPSSDSEMFGSFQAVFFIKLMEVFTLESWKIDFPVLKAGLEYLEIISSIFVHFTPYTEFKKWLDAKLAQLYSKIGGWDQVLLLETENYDMVEYQVRNSVLQLALEDKAVQAQCKKCYKNFVNSGNGGLVPREFLTLMFNVSMINCTMNEYKQVLSLVKNSDVSFINHTTGTVNDVQTSALYSLGFCSKREILAKTLHFVNTNIDSKLIELGLMGFKYCHSDEVKSMVWAWYNVNYDGWIKRSLRKGSDWSKQIGITVGNITRLVLGEIMEYKRDEVMRFIEQKEKSLPAHGLRERYEKVDLENHERRIIGGYYGDVVGEILKEKKGEK